MVLAPRIVPRAESGEGASFRHGEAAPFAFTPKPHSAGQPPLHRLHAAGIAAADDDAEIAASLFERCRVDVQSPARRIYEYTP